ncbi:MAG: YggS family pyridoxal phosphate-dependent enzyme [Bdellovibrionales bacterium]|nr:YggS family pyridoxal phosphate-dependent enzyme [Bdellovibrionales bacterium]
MLVKKINELQKTVEDSLSHSGRNKEQLKILLASKTVSVETLQEAIKAGCSYFGENRAQELLQKKQALAGQGVRWDYIGHLQSNKVRDIVGKVNLIHSVDRVSVAAEIQKQAEAQSLVQNILIEVNTSGEETKSGVHPSDWQNLAVEILNMPNIKICGLMTIATNTEDVAVVRKCFKDLYGIRIDLARLLKVDMNQLELSMGMSNDFAMAIEEGATIIRVGSLVFGERI